MQINLSFDTLAELQEFASWAAGLRGQYTEVRDGELVHITDTRPVTAEGAVIDAPQDSDEAANAGADEASSTDPVTESKPKRKRRTKAEIAADEAAAPKVGPNGPVQQVLNAGAIIDKGDGTAVFADGKGGEIGRADPLAKMNQAANGARELAAAATAGVNPEIVALAATIDGADKLAHMNEGREFISAHGFPKYNETFALADVPANIVAHTPEQASLHRAAMQWIVAQGGES